MRDIGYGEGDDKLMAEIEADGFGTLAGPQFQTPIPYLGDRVSFVEDTHPTAPPLTLYGIVTALKWDTVTVWVDEGWKVSVPYGKVKVRR